MSDPAVSLRLISTLDDAKNDGKCGLVGVSPLTSCSSAVFEFKLRYSVRLLGSLEYQWLTG